MMYALKFYHCGDKNHPNNGYFIESTTSCNYHNYIRTDRSKDLSQVLSSFIKSDYLAEYMSETCIGIRLDRKDIDYIETICEFDNIEQFFDLYPEAFL